MEADAEQGGGDAQAGDPDPERERGLDGDAEPRGQTHRERKGPELQEAVGKVGMGREAPGP